MDLWHKLTVPMTFLHRYAAQENLLIIRTIWPNNVSVHLFVYERGGWIMSNSVRTWTSDLYISSIVSSFTTWLYVSSFTTWLTTSSLHVVLLCLIIFKIPYKLHLYWQLTIVEMSSLLSIPIKWTTFIIIDLNAF